jgi:hypothetical protein
MERREGEKGGSKGGGGMRNIMCGMTSCLKAFFLPPSHSYQAGHSPLRPSELLVSSYPSSLSPASVLMC